MNELKQALVTACKILVTQRLDSGPFGNVSMRIPGTQQFLINPEGVTFTNITIQDISFVNDNNYDDAISKKPHPGFFIHGAIYQRRQDINAIVHTHSMSTVLISLLGKTILPYTQIGAAMANDQGIYHGFTGPVRDFEEGMAIADALDQNSYVVAKNHGIFATGKSIQAALWDMIIADQAAEIHCQALKMGINASENLPLKYKQKSRLEVRDLQAEQMWHNFISNL